jgi:epoxyqueuosine reductase
MGTHVFGCDICQDVCPYNVRCRPTAEAAFQPRSGLFEPELTPLLRLTEAEFKEKFRGSPILRAKRRGFLRNVCVALGNLGRAEAVPALAEALARDPEPLVRAHAAWALGRIGGAAAAAALEEARSRETDPGVADEIRLALGADGGGPVSGPERAPHPPPRSP